MDKSQEKSRFIIEEGDISFLSEEELKKLKDEIEKRKKASEQVSHPNKKPQE